MCAFDIALEGFSRVRRCSQEGRLAMTLDAADLYTGLDQVRTDPSPSSSSRSLPGQASPSSSSSSSVSLSVSVSSQSKGEFKDGNATRDVGKEKDKGREKDKGKEKSGTGSGGGSAWVSSDAIRSGKEKVDNFIQATYMPEEGTGTLFLYSVWGKVV